MQPRINLEEQALTMPSSANSVLFFIPKSLLLTLFSLIFGFMSLAALAEPLRNTLPTGGQVEAGTGSISTAGGVMTIRQDTDKLITNWQSFDIGSGAKVDFRQPGASSIALNRIHAQRPSEIFGQLTANGRVVLLNPEGIVFGSGSQVNVGALVASTLQLSDQDFLSDNYKLSKGMLAGSIINDGVIKTSSGGVVALVAPVIKHSGGIETPNGTTLLAAGEEVSLDFRGDGVLRYTLDRGAIGALIQNDGSISAPNGQIILSAKAFDAATKSSINNTGIIEASSLVHRGGRVLLEADEILLSSGSTLQATGAKGGGEVLVGGNWQGSGDLRQALTVLMETGATIDVSATDQGNGGTAVLWTDIHDDRSLTSVHGQILASGGGKRR